MSAAHDAFLVERMEAMSETEAARMATIAASLIKRLEPVVKAYKTAYGDRIDPQGVQVVVDGMPAATVQRVPSSDGRLTVTDPLAYGRALENIHADIPDRAISQAWDTVPYPKPEACEEAYLRQLARDNDGILPPGVELRGGRPETVRLTLDRGFTSRPVTMQSVQDGLRFIEEGEGDNHE